MIAAAWFGSAVCLLAIATPAAFRASPNATAAANVVGAMLTPWHYVALAAPLLLLLLPKGGIKLPQSVLAIAILLAATQAIIDTQIRSIRMKSPVPISALSRQNPVRRKFGILHGISSLALLGEAIAAAVVIARTDP